MHHINRIKNKNQMIISINSRKAFDKNPKTFMIKTHDKQRIEGNFLNEMIKIIFKKHIANIIHNGDRTGVLPLKSATRQKWP